MRVYFAIFVATLCAFCLGAWPQQPKAPVAQSAESEISLTEAEILIYVLPEARQIRTQGMDIGWELETGPSQNTEDFYIFWVVNAKGKGHVGSVTIGYFGVNKHTADVWDVVLRKVISDADLKGIQKILRGGHHISTQTIEKYRDFGP